MSDKIPIFPLPLVVLPGEKIPLHIFEEKYKKMIEYCLKNDKKFGIVNTKNNDSLIFGCTVSIEKVFSEDQSTGEYDIIVAGEERFIVKSYNHSKSFKEAYVTIWEDSDIFHDSNSLQKTNALFYEVLLKLGETTQISQFEAPKSSYEICSMLDINLNAKRILLKSQSENDRLILIRRLLKKAIIKLDQTKGGYLQDIEHMSAQFEA